jgi:hypothetical protein
LRKERVGVASPWNDHLEWLETDGLGCFASGTVGGSTTRRYHGDNWSRVSGEKPVRQ